MDHPEVESPHYQHPHEPLTKLQKSTASGKRCLFYGRPAVERVGRRVEPSVCGSLGRFGPAREGSWAAGRKRRENSVREAESARSVCTDSHGRRTRTLMPSEGMKGRALARRWARRLGASISSAYILWRVRSTDQAGVERGCIGVGQLARWEHGERAPVTDRASLVDWVNPLSLYRGQHWLEQTDRPTRLDCERQKSLRAYRQGIPSYIHHFTYPTLPLPAMNIYMYKHSCVCSVWERVGQNGTVGFVRRAEVPGGNLWIDRFAFRVFCIDRLDTEKKLSGFP